MPPRFRATSALRGSLQQWRATPPPFLRRYVQSSRQRPEAGVGALVGRWALRFAQVFLFSHLVFEYVVTVNPTHGVSMVPTIPSAELNQFWQPHVLISKLFYRRGKNIQVGDIVQFNHPMMPGSTMAKRVIGMPGDFVSVVTSGRRDLPFEGELLSDTPFARVQEDLIRVPEGHCWVAGDNLEWSRDSRVFGPVPLALVRGKVVALVLPLNQMKWFRSGLEDVKEEHEPTALRP